MKVEVPLCSILGYEPVVTRCRFMQVLLQQVVSSFRLAIPQRIPQVA